MQLTSINHCVILHQMLHVTGCIDLHKGHRNQQQQATVNAWHIPDMLEKDLCHTCWNVSRGSWNERAHQCSGHTQDPRQIHRSKNHPQTFIHNHPHNSIHPSATFWIPPIPPIFWGESNSADIYGNFEGISLIIRLVWVGFISWPLFFIAKLLG